MEKTHITRKKINLSRRETMIHKFKSVKAHVIKVQTPRT